MRQPSIDFPARIALLFVHSSSKVPPKATSTLLVSTQNALYSTRRRIPMYARDQSGVEALRRGELAHQIRQRCRCRRQFFGSVKALEPAVNGAFRRTMLHVKPFLAVYNSPQEARDHLGKSNRGGTKAACQFVSSQSMWSS